MLCLHRFWRGLYNRFDRGMHPRQSVEDYLLAIQEETQQLEEQVSSHKQVGWSRFPKSFFFLNYLSSHRLYPQYFIMSTENWTIGATAGVGSGTEGLPWSWKFHRVGARWRPLCGQHSSGLHWALPDRQPLSAETTRQQPGLLVQRRKPKVQSHPVHQQWPGVRDRWPELSLTSQWGQHQGPRLRRSCLNLLPEQM